MLQAGAFDKDPMAFGRVPICFHIPRFLANHNIMAGSAGAVVFRSFIDVGRDAAGIEVFDYQEFCGPTAEVTVGKEVVRMGGG